MSAAHPDPVGVEPPAVWPMPSVRPWPFMATPLQPREFVVQVKAGARVVRQFPVMGFYRTHVQAAHECLCEPGQQIVALTVEEAAQRAGRSA